MVYGTCTALEWPASCFETFLEDNNPDVLKSKLTSSLSDIVVIDSRVIRSFNRIKFAVFKGLFLFCHL